MPPLDAFKQRFGGIVGPEAGGSGVQQTKVLEQLLEALRQQEDAAAALDQAREVVYLFLSCLFIYLVAFLIGRIKMLFEPPAGTRRIEAAASVDCSREAASLYLWAFEQCKGQLMYLSIQVNASNK